MDIKDKWTQDDYAEYGRQLELMRKAWGYCIPDEILERRAAEIINYQKQQTK